MPSLGRGVIQSSPGPRRRPRSHSCISTGSGEAGPCCPAPPAWLHRAPAGGAPQSRDPVSAGPVAGRRLGSRAEGLPAAPITPASGHVTAPSRSPGRSTPPRHPSPWGRRKRHPKGRPRRRWPPRMRFPGHPMGWRPRGRQITHQSLATQTPSDPQTPPGRGLAVTPEGAGLCGATPTSATHSLSGPGHVTRPAVAERWWSRVVSPEGRAAWPGRAPHLCRRSGRALPCRTASTCRRASPPPRRGCGGAASAPGWREG